MKNTHTLYFKVLSLHVFLLIIFGNTLQAQCPGDGEPDWLEPIPNPFGLSAPMGEDTLNWIKLVDIDNDDTLEAFIFSQRTSSPDWEDLTYFENTGSNAAPQFELQGSYPFNMPENNPNWLWQLVDIDGDTLKDYIAYGFLLDNPVTVIFNNALSTAEQPDFSNGFTYSPFGIAIPESGGELWDGVAPTFVDIDANGSLDLFYGGFFNGSEPEAFYYSENTSIDPTDPQYADPEPNPFGLNFPPGYNLHNMTFGDVDCDNDLDMYFLGRAGTQTYFFFFENTGNASSPDFSEGYQDAKARGAMGNLIDIGGDGDMDLITSMGHGVWFYENPIIISTNELQLDATLKLNPNPTSDFLNFELTSEEHLDQVEVEIFNIVGQKMTSLSFQSFDNYIKERVSLNDMPSGVYMLKINSKDKFLVHKFVKQ